MVRLLIFTGLFSLLVTTTWSQRLNTIPNGSFENWAQENNVLKPEQWNASDSIRPTTDASQGDSAVKMQPLQGFETAPQFLSTTVKVGESADLLSANVKTNIRNNQDTVYFRAKVYYRDNDTQTQQWQTSQNIDSYKRVNLSLNDKIMDSAKVSFQSGCCADLGGADRETVFKVDDVRFESSSSTKRSTEKPELKIFPNPVAQQLSLKGLNRSGNYQIFNSLGQKVQEGDVPASGSVQVGGLPQGVYTLRLSLHPLSGTKVGTFIKQ